MLRKEITFTDLDGRTRTQPFYFNLSEAEILSLELQHTKIVRGEDGNVEEGGFAAAMQAVVDSGDGNVIIETFKEILRMAYGVRSDDGITFMKSKEISANFEMTDAYSVLFVQLVTDAGFAADFINAVVPERLRGAAEAKAAQTVRSPEQIRADSLAAKGGFQRRRDLRTEVTEESVGVVPTDPQQSIREQMRAEIEAEIRAEEAARTTEAPRTYTDDRIIAVDPRDGS